ncbi:hypothetical protein [Pseudomonas sp. CF161]|uniref:hypothetical protein n=1 Tax=Pseudomonas sp. CF161 TaxID=911241 RepID=UPI00035513C7|nr:hypothetical protein [Pseudomonas sp. CF161]EPL03885.1 hypothetical protein CF161_28740 [Pseudomonas sp. CF161]
MTDKNVWYLPGPFHRYEDDVKALAKKAGLRIIDANMTENRDNEAEKPPKAKLKAEYRESGKAAADPRDKFDLDQVKAALTEKSVTFDDKADQPTLLKLLKAQD